MADIRDLVRLDGRVAIVTGGARGIGRETAEMLAAAGARVAVADLDKAAAEAAAAAMRAAGLHAFAIAVDVADEAKRGGDGPGDPRERRAPRHSRQQRRHRDPPSRGRTRSGGLGQGGRGQHDRRFLMRPRRRPADDRQRRGRDRQCRLDRRPVGRRPLPQHLLSGDEGRDRQHDPRARGGMGARTEFA